MIYAHFKRDDEKGINAFLKENDKYIASNGIFPSGESFSFIFDTSEPLTAEQLQNIEVANIIKEKIVQSETEVALQAVEVQHIEEGIKHSDKGSNPSSLADAKAYLNSLKRKLEITKNTVMK